MKYNDIHGNNALESNVVPMPEKSIKLQDKASNAVVVTEENYEDVVRQIDFKFSNGLGWSVFDSRIHSAEIDDIERVELISNPAVVRAVEILSTSIADLITNTL